jgi:hypothetical protein
MIICIDTNTLIQGRVPRHRYFPILDAVVAGRRNWAISNRVLAGYEEIVTASGAGISEHTETSADFCGFVPTFVPIYGFSVRPCLLIE